MKYLPIVKYILLIASAILIVIGMVQGAADNDSAALNVMLVWSAIVVILTVVLTIVMPLIAVFQNPKSAVRSLIGLAVIIVVFLVSYALSSTDPIKLASGEEIVSHFDLKFSDTALYATYFAFAAVILSILYGEFSKLFKK